MGSSRGRCTAAARRSSSSRLVPWARVAQVRASGAVLQVASRRRSTHRTVLLADLVATSRLVAAASARLEKIALLAALLERLAPDEIAIAVGFLIGWPRQG